MADSLYSIMQPFCLVPNGSISKSQIPLHRPYQKGDLIVYWLSYNLALSLIFFKWTFVLYFFHLKLVSFYEAQVSSLMQLQQH